MKVKNYIELEKALREGEKIIELANSMSVPNGISLGDGQKLISGGNDVFLSFINGDGVSLSGDNEISNISIQTSPDKRAIYIDSSLEDLKEIKLSNLTITGMVKLLTRGKNKKLSLKIENMDIVAADTRKYPERPMKYGVNVYQGALTIYNYNPDSDSEIRVRIDGISIGRNMAPVIGSGLFISGFSDDTGRVYVERLATNDIYSNGMIPTGQLNLITGGIFIVYGAHAKEIVSNGTVKTYGTNDMVLDVWGSVDSWIAREKIVSYEPSGIGFVNFGEVKDFRAEGNIETYGLGARGFNQYDGTIENAYFENIETLGDGSIGMQFSKPVGKITIGKNVTTHGSTGQTLVKGEIKTLNADAISVLAGGSIEELNVLGDIVTNGENSVGYHVNGGLVKNMNLAGKISVNEKISRDIVIENGGQSNTI